MEFESKDSLAYEVLQMQRSYKLPGLYSECSEILSTLNLGSPGCYSRNQWKNIIKKEIYRLNMKELVDEASKYRKIEYEIGDSFHRENYLSELKVADARMMFKLRTKMMPTVQMNFVNDEKFKKNFWTCSGCSELNNSSLQIQGRRDAQSHILQCPGYSDIRSRLNLDCDSELVQYFKSVIKRRINLLC